MKKGDKVYSDDNLTRKIKGAIKIEKMTGDASVRNYYRIYFKNHTLVAMEYPEKNTDEISKIIKLTNVYLNAGLNVPLIKDQIDERVLLLEDLGDISLQTYLGSIPNSGLTEVKNEIFTILSKLKNIPTGMTTLKLDNSRMVFETDFFVDNFVKKFSPDRGDIVEIREEILSNIKKIKGKRVFSHRDFHSRNIFFKSGKFFLIDFQDSLTAPEYYDSVSFVFDSYIGVRMTNFFHSFFENLNEVDLTLMKLTGYQRIIKALGTFGYQVFSGNGRFLKYILPAIKNLKKTGTISESPRLFRFINDLEKSGKI